ncbi:MAG: ABC transporter substrate-binding protein [Alphaproteobacteria bacterium]|nr:ABC transporter substrate-binding protein [Alphaproteobacteria bacterium]
MKKVNWKSIVGWGVAALVVVCIIGTNMHQQRQLETGKRNLYALLPLTGVIAQPGQDYKAAMEVSYKNLKNPKINIVYIDSQFQPTQAVTALQQATLDDEHPLVLAWTLAIASAVIPQVGDKGFIFSGSTVEHDDLKKNNNYERLSTTSTKGVQLIVDYLSKNHKKVALVHSNDVYGHANKGAFVKHIQNYPLEYVVMDFENKSLSMRDLVYKLLAKNPDLDAIFISAPASHGFLEFFKELKSQGFKGEVLADIAFSQKFVFDTLGELAEDIVFVTLEPQLTEPRNQKATEFRKLALDNGLYPSFTSIEAYDMVMVINHMIENNIPLTQESFLKMKKFLGAAGEILFTDKGDAVYPFILATIKNGKIIPVENE